MDQVGMKDASNGLYVPILVYQHHVEPFSLIIFLWHVHPDPITPQFVVHSRVLDVTDSIHG
jgi:hypothetical protein